MAAFTAYFDASGSQDDQPVLAVGGFLACTEAWLEFEQEWEARLTRDGLDYFRTSEFNSYRGQFKTGWRKDEGRRVQLITDLVQIIHGLGRKFGCVVVNKSLNATFSDQARTDWNLGA